MGPRTFVVLSCFLAALPIFVAEEAHAHEARSTAVASTGYKSGFFVVSASTARPFPGVPVFHKPIAGYDEPDIDAILSDGTGGWYVGGDFTAVGNSPCTNLVHVKLGQPVTRASCFPTNGTVLALARQGDKVFVGGLFTEIGGRKRNYIAAIDTRTSVVSTWDAHLGSNRQQGPYVHAIAISGKVVYLGGAVLVSGGSPVDVAAVDTATARPLPGWHSVRLSQGGHYVEVAALAATRDRVYVAGYPYGLVAVDARTGHEVRRVQPHSVAGDSNGPTLDAVAATASAVYVGGYFARIGSVPRSAVAALDPWTLRPTHWRTSIPPYNAAKSTYSEIVAIVARPDRVYVGGQFYAPRLIIGVAAFATATGRRLPWLVNGSYAPEQIQALAVFRNTVAFGPGLCKRDLNGCARP